MGLRSRRPTSPARRKANSRPTGSPSRSRRHSPRAGRRPSRRTRRFVGEASDSSYAAAPQAVPRATVPYDPRMDAHELAGVIAQREATGRPYLEFITVPDLSVGLYVLEPGEPDLQQPH